MSSTDEYVMESFTTFDKMKSLIYDLLMTEVWKENVFPLVKSQFTKINSIRSYMAVSIVKFPLTSYFVFLSCTMKPQFATCLKCSFTIGRPVKVQTTSLWNWLTTATESSQDFSTNAITCQRESTFSKALTTQTLGKHSIRMCRRRKSCRSSLMRLNLTAQWSVSVWLGSSQTTWRHFPCQSSIRWWRITIFHVCLSLSWSTNHG